MDFNNLSIKELAVAKVKCNQSLLFSTRFWFRVLRGSKFILNWHHEEICKALEEVADYKYKLLNINIPPRFSKCISQDTMIMTSSGLKEARYIKKGDILYSYKDGELVKNKCLGTEKAYKESLKLTTRSGRDIICSYDHPLLTTHGYKEVKDIEIGERLKVINSKVYGTYKIDDSELIFTTLMIFEGDCGSRNIRFSNTDKCLIDLMKRVVSKIGFTIKKYNSSKKPDWHIMGGDIGLASNILKKYGIRGHKCYTKRIPAKWFNLNLRQKLIFIDLMFATDGYVNTSSGSSGIGLANEGLIKDIQHLLSTIGIISTMYFNENDYANSWQLHISRTDTKKLTKLITFYHKRGNALKCLDKSDISLTDTFPYSIIKKEKLSYKTRAVGLRCENVKEISRNKFYKLCDEFPQLKKYLDRDFFLDMVDKIENVGFKDLIHIEVEDTKNFIANGIVSHNTELAGINLIAWSLANNPKGNFLYITASDELRSETSIRIRDIITHPYYKRMYGVEMKKDQTGKNLWRTSQGGGLKTATIFGQITGFGAGRMVDVNNELIEFIKEFDGAIILDDINKIGDTQANNANNKKAIDTIFTTILSRVNSMRTPIINIQQRAGENDASSALLEFFDESESKNLVLPVVYDGKPLWEGKLNLEAIEQLRTSDKTAHVFETQYMQNPQPLEGLMFPKTELNYFKLPELDLKKVESKKMVIDPADKGDDNYALALGCHIGQYIYIKDVIYSKETFEVTEPLTIELGTNNDIDMAFLETNKEGTLFKRNLQKEFKNIRVKGIHNTTNKVVRIRNNAFFIKKYMIFRNDYALGSDYDKFMKDVFAFLQDGSNKDHDDAPDCLATYAKQVRKLYPELYN